jgi:hypothetical protein
MLQLFYPCGKSHWYMLDRKLDGSPSCWAHSDGKAKKQKFILGFEPKTYHFNESVCTLSVQSTVCLMKYISADTNLTSSFLHMVHVSLLYVIMLVWQMLYEFGFLYNLRLMVI